jgi:hypothetical protein
MNPTEPFSRGVSGRKERERKKKERKKKLSASLMSDVFAPYRERNMG